MNREQQGGSVSRKRECKAMKFVEDTNPCELRSSELIFLVFLRRKLVESRCKSVENSAVLL